MKRKFEIILFLLIASFNCLASDELLSLKTIGIEGNKSKIILNFSNNVPDPKYFSVEHPAKLVFDFPKVISKLSDEDSEQNIEIGAIRGLDIVESNDKMRLVVSVHHITPFYIKKSDKQIIIIIDDDSANIGKHAKIAKNNANPNSNDTHDITAIDFRRGDEGEGRLVLDITGNKVPVDVTEDNGDMLVQFKGAHIVNSLIRNYEVRDFGTPIKSVKVSKKDKSVFFRVKAEGPFEKVAYQVGHQFVIEAKPLTEEEHKLSKQKFKFNGDRISLNFQEIEIRAVLRLMADFTGLNLVASDSVSGTVTLRLEDVPWDQALDFILRSKGLSKFESAGVILVAPNEELIAREQLELEVAHQSEELVKLHSEFIQINYAKAEDMVALLKGEENSILSARGQVSVDARTNTLLLVDTVQKLSEVKEIIKRLDVPVKQVLIESQIVQTVDDLDEQFGMKFAMAATPQIGKYRFGIGQNNTTARSFANNPSSKTTSGVTSPTSTTTTTGNTTTTGTNTSAGLLNASLSNAAALGRIGLAIAKLPGGTLLDLELQASEQEKKSKVLARPKLMTLDKQKASIETGQEIPFSTAAADGGGTATAVSTTTFKKAVLKLEVTPQITPDNKISMELGISQDSVGEEVNGQVAINTTEMSTNVQVKDGETIVLGGIFQRVLTRTKDYIPILGRIPVVGNLFKKEVGKNSKNEILIFVTPKIINNIQDVSVY